MTLADLVVALQAAAADLRATEDRDQKAMGELVAEIARLRARVAELEAIRVQGAAATAGAESIGSSAVVVGLDGAAISVGAGAVVKR